MRTEIILEIIAIIIGLYLALFKSYFQEKGKNIATSEDIEGLTSKVESIKQQFLEKNAHLKARLDLLTNIQINHKNEERSVLINYHKCLKSWIGLLIRSSLPVIDDYNNDEIKSTYIIYENIFNEVINAEALLDLYIDDQKLIEIINKLKIETLTNLSSHPITCLTEIQYNNIKIKNLDFEQNLDIRKEKHIRLLDERKIIYQTYRDKMMDGLKKNIIVEREYNIYVKKFLLNLSSN